MRQPDLSRPPEQWEREEIIEAILTLEQILKGIVAMLDVQLDDMFGEKSLRLERLETFLFPLLPKERKAEFADDWIPDTLETRRKLMEEERAKDAEEREAVLKERAEQGKAKIDKAMKEG